MAETKNESGSKLETTRQPPSAPGEENHDEWLIDEAIEETFPASDPVLPTRPGSTLSKRNEGELSSGGDTPAGKR